jgi:hypothetical protein
LAYPTREPLRVPKDQLRKCDEERFEAIGNRLSQYPDEDIEIDSEPEEEY